MYKNKILNILVLFLIMIGLVNYSFATEIEITNTVTTDSKFHKINALEIPEKDINFKVLNLTRGCECYLLLPNELLNYNLEKFINNNIENQYEVQKKKAQDLKKFYDEKDYIGYIEYLAKEGFEIEENSIEIRHYCFSINESTEIVGYTDYNNSTYVKIKINMKNNSFKLKMKDYLMDYDVSSIVFLVDEYGEETYVKTSDYPLTKSIENYSVDEYNIDFSLYSKEDYVAINRAIDIGYALIYIIVGVTIICIIVYEIRKRKRHKAEIAERLFWKPKTPKMEKEIEKLHKYNEHKENREKRKSKNKKKKE